MGVDWALLAVGVALAKSRPPSPTLARVRYKGPIARDSDASASH